MSSIMKTMNKYNSLALKLWTEEHACFLEGAFVQKIQQPSRRELLLVLRNKGESKKLYINIHPDFFHLCFINDKNINSHPCLEQNSNNHPPMFCMQLRKHLEGQKIQRAAVVQYERILELYFDSFDEFGSKTPLCLALELMGKHSNIILYNNDTNVILGCAHNVSSGKSRERELSGGLPYIYPPKQKKNDFLKQYQNGILRGELAKDYHYFSAALAEAINNDFIKAKEILTDQKVALDALKTVYSCGANSCHGINDVICNYFSKHLCDFQIQVLKNTLKLNVQKEIRKIKKSIASLGLNNDEKQFLYKQKGDLILQNIYNIKKGDEKFQTRDMIIELDVSRSPSENAQRYYSLYSKTKTAGLKREELLKERNEKLLYFKEIDFSIDNSCTIDDLKQVEEELGLKKAVLSSKSHKAKIEIDRYEIEGGQIYIGKNNKQNDYIVSKIAAAEDYWFHVLNTPGSHVLLKVQGEPNENQLLEAATLAKYYSTARDNAKASVIYTKRKYIKKPPNTFLGYVTYKNEKEIVV